MSWISYSQSGQDMLIRYFMRKYRLISSDKNYRGFYVDVGCNEPKSDSNTFHFYEKEWSGICIDANPAMIEKFQNERPRDKAVLCGIGLKETIRDFYVSNRPQSSSFALKSPDRLEKVIPIQIRRLSRVLTENDVSSIDFMSIDVEGMETQVIASLDFDRHRPKLIVIEIKSSIKDIFNAKVVEILTDHGYVLICHTGHDAYFVFKGAAAETA